MGQTDGRTPYRYVGAVAYYASRVTKEGRPGRWCCVWLEQLALRRTVLTQVNWATHSQFDAENSTVIVDTVRRRAFLLRLVHNFASRQMNWTSWPSYNERVEVGRHAQSPAQASRPTRWAKKRGHRLMTVILSNIDRFKKFPTGRFPS